MGEGKAPRTDQGGIGVSSSACPSEAVQQTHEPLHLREQLSMVSGESLRINTARLFLHMTVLSVLGMAWSLVAIPYARAAGEESVPIRPQALALTRTVLPHGASLQGRIAGDKLADASSDLHTVSFAQLGRLTGYLQAARWTVSDAHTHKVTAVTLQYLVSIFAGADSAASARGDARASLWESGHPIASTRNAGSSFPPVFAAVEGRHMNTYAVMARGRIEWEVRVSVGTPVSTRTSQAVTRQLLRIARAALREAPQSEPVATVSNSAVTTPIATAPWGAGPIVKSPSLLAVDDWTEAQPDPGAFRTRNSRAADHALAPALLYPTGGVSRFVRTSSPTPAVQIYDDVVLYSTPDAAADALNALTSTNSHRGSLRAFDAHLILAGLPNAGLADAADAWRGTDESIVALRAQNVVMVLASSGTAPRSLAASAGSVLARVPTWLHADGVRIARADGTEIRLAGMNWYGAEEQDFVVGGLDFQPYTEILQSIWQQGYNEIRLPFSNQLVERNPIVTAHLAANPELQGLHALDILDRLVNYAGALGISVVLDDHRSDAGWSTQPDGLWYTAQYPDRSFVNDWLSLAHRYSVNNVVVGADLRNEPHAGATWGSGNAATDWKMAAERAGDAVLAANPHLLVIVEGVQYYGTSPGYWWGGNLIGVATDPVRLHFADGTDARSQLVYSAHDYGEDNCGGGCPWFTATTSYADLANIWDQYWGYIATDPTKPYAAPVWVGEFGTCNYQPTCGFDTTPGSQGQWFSSLVHYIGDRGLSWAYWSINGTQSTANTRVYGVLDWYGFLDPGWTHPIAWLDSILRTIQGNPAAPGSPPGTVAAKP